MAQQKQLLGIYLSLRRKLAGSIASLVAPADVEDIVQETYVRICQINKPEPIESPHAFLYRTVKNLALDYRKRAAVRLTDSMDDVEELESLCGRDLNDQTFDSVASGKSFERFCEAVRLLPPQCRRAFVLRKVYGLSQQEIAVEMGISMNTVENHIATGIKRCAEFMQKHDEHYGRRSPPTAKPSRKPSHVRSYNSVETPER